MAKEASCKVCATYQVKYLVLRSTTRTQRLAYLPPDMACETLKRLHIVAPLTLHYQLHPALAPALSYILLLYPHIRNDRTPPALPRPGPRPRHRIRVLQPLPRRRTRQRAHPEPAEGRLREARGRGAGGTLFAAGGGGGARGRLGVRRPGENNASVRGMRMKRTSMGEGGWVGPQCTCVRCNLRLGGARGWRTRREPS